MRADRESILEQYRLGITIKEIAKRHNCAATTVGAIARKAGLSNGARRDGITLEEANQFAALVNDGSTQAGRANTEGTPGNWYTDCN